MRKLLAGLGVVAILSGCNTDAIAGDDNTKNDTVFHQDQYREFFKEEGDGKNYLYTVTEWDAKDGRHCIVVSGDSEKTITMSCERRTG